MSHITINNPNAPASARQVSALNDFGIEVTAGLTMKGASDLIAGHYEANPGLREQRVAASREARNAKLRAKPGTPGQVAFIRKVTKGKYVPTNALQIEVWFRRFRTRKVGESGQQAVAEATGGAQVQMAI